MADINPFGNPGGNDEMMFEIDIEGTVEENLVPEGTYTGKCINIEKTTSKAGNPMWSWTFAIIEGPHAGKDMKLFTALTPAAIWKLSETLDAFGLVKSGQAVKFGKADVLNIMVEMVVVHDEYNNQKRESLDKVLPYHGGVGIRHTGGSAPVPGI